jgi:dTDP-4-amino-4,6-dideoxygalactose transaminase
MRKINLFISGHSPIVMPGYNYKMGDIHVVIRLNQLKHLEEFIEKRNKFAKNYNQELEKIGWIEPQKIYSHSTNPYYVYIVETPANSPVSRDILMRHLRGRC